MYAYATSYLAEHKLLEEGETLLAYYDATLSMDGTEAAILTSSRIIYHKDGQTQAIRYDEIEDVREIHNGALGLEFSVHAKDGRAIRIDIPPLNGGEIFKGELMSRWEKAKAK
jgi:hypothetical protein